MTEDKDCYLEHEDDFLDLSDLETDEDDSDDEGSVTETHLLQNKTQKKENKFKKSQLQRRLSSSPSKITRETKIHTWVYLTLEAQRV